MKTYEVVRYSQRVIGITAPSAREALAIAKDIDEKQFTELDEGWAVYDGEQEVISNG